MYVRCGLFYRKDFYITYNNKNPLLAALSALFVRSPACACLEFHAPGGVRFGVDFAPYLVIKRFASAARQIMVCVVFCPMGVEQTRVGAILGRKAEPRHAVHPMRAGHGREDRPREREKEQRMIASGRLKALRYGLR